MQGCRVLQGGQQPLHPLLSCWGTDPHLEKTISKEATKNGLIRRFFFSCGWKWGKHLAGRKTQTLNSNIKDMYDIHIFFKHKIYV